MALCHQQIHRKSGAQSIQRVVTPNTHILPRHPSMPPLPQDDVSGGRLLVSENFDPQVLGVRGSRHAACDARLLGG